MKKLVDCEEVLLHYCSDEKRWVVISVDATGKAIPILSTKSIDLLDLEEKYVGIDT
jgi:hypothetical protein